MKLLTAALVFLLGMDAAGARPVAFWPYSKLVEESDFVAVVEVESIEDVRASLMGHGEPKRFQGKVAHLKTGWVIKGEPAERVDMKFFTYSPDGLVEPNGAMFVSFEDSDKYQFMVFLKREGEEWVPVTGHYDAAVSVKVIKKDHLSPIK